MQVCQLIHRLYYCIHDLNFAYSSSLATGSLGHYIPQLANVIVEENKKASKENYINFKGILIGNAYMDGDTDLQGIVDSAWHHAIISDTLYSAFLKSCDFSIEILSPECDAALSEFFLLYKLIDVYSL